MRARATQADQNNSVLSRDDIQDIRDHYSRLLEWSEATYGGCIIEGLIAAAAWMNAPERIDDIAFVANEIRQGRWNEWFDDEKEAQGFAAYVADARRLEMRLRTRAIGR